MRRLFDKELHIKIRENQFEITDLIETVWIGVEVSAVEARKKIAP